mgnify:FL=1
MKRKTNEDNLRAARARLRAARTLLRQAATLLRQSVGLEYGGDVDGAQQDTSWQQKVRGTRQW